MGIFIWTVQALYLINLFSFTYQFFSGLTLLSNFFPQPFYVSYLLLILILDWRLYICRKWIFLSPQSHQGNVYEYNACILNTFSFQFFSLSLCIIGIYVEPSSPLFFLSLLEENVKETYPRSLRDFLTFMKNYQGLLLPFSFWWQLHDEIDTFNLNLWGV